MADGFFDFKIAGDKDVEKVLLNLPKAHAKIAYVPALKAGGKVIRKLASQKVTSIVSNEATGTLAKSLAVYKLKTVQGNYRVAVMVRRGAVNKLKLVRGEPVRVGLYGSVLEYRDGGRFSWLRPAAREGTNAAFQAVLTEFGNRLNDSIQEAKR